MFIRRSSFIVVAVMMFSLPAQLSFAADKLRIGYSGATITNSMLWVTHEGRLFEKNGIDAEILYLQTTLGQTAMIAGEIQMCVYSASLLTPARLQGADVVMLLAGCWRRFRPHSRPTGSLSSAGCWHPWRMDAPRCF